MLECDTLHYHCPLMPTPPQKKAKISQYLSRETWSTFGEILREFEFFCSTFPKYDNFWNKIVDMPLKEVGNTDTAWLAVLYQLGTFILCQKKSWSRYDLRLRKPLTSYFSWIRQYGAQRQLCPYEVFIIWKAAKPLNNHKLVSVSSHDWQ